MEPVILDIAKGKYTEDAFGTSRFLMSNAKKFEKTDLSLSISLKFVLSGIEHYRVNGKSFELDHSKYLIVDHKSEVNVFIDSDTHVRGACIYPSKDLIVDVLNNYRYSDQDLLDNHIRNDDFVLVENSYRQCETKAGHYMSQHLPFILENITNPELNFDNFFIGIAESLVQDQIDIKDRLKALDATRKTTKIELFKRVSESREFIEDNYSQKINLEELASNACLSKYHFLRSFKAIYKQSPYQYLLGLKLQKAKELLQKDYSYSQINHMVGYSDVKNLRRALSKAS